MPEDKYEAQTGSAVALPDLDPDELAVEPLAILGVLEQTVRLGEGVRSGLGSAG
jgi:hypothetical protein